MRNKSYQNVMGLVSSILDIDQNLSGEEYLKQFIKNIALTLNIKYALIGHPIDKNLTKIQTDVVWASDDFYDNFVYELKDTPCELVLTGERVCIHESNVCIDFPDDLLLQEMGIEAYVGAPVVSKHESGVSSILVLLDDKPMEDKLFFSSITEFLALRASAEIEKLLIEDNLKKEVEKRTYELKIANEEILSLNKNLEKRVEQEVQKNLQQQSIILEQSKMATMGEMIENIAHQWRQPISTVSTASSALKMEKELDVLTDENFFHALDVIDESVKYLSNTITDFRNFFSKNKVKTHFKIKDVFEKSFKLMSGQLKRIEIEFTSDGNDAEIYAYENELLQVIINILNNAKEELEKTKYDKFIFIKVYKENEEILISIKDNAGGIKEDILDKVFDNYFTTKKNIDGTGIGLYMSKQIIKENMNGSITVTNKKSKINETIYEGAEFLIKLPLI